MHPSCKVVPAASTIAVGQRRKYRRSKADFYFFSRFNMKAPELKTFRVIIREVEHLHVDVVARTGSEAEELADEMDYDQYVSTNDCSWKHTSRSRLKRRKPPRGAFFLLPLTTKAVIRRTVTLRQRCRLPKSLPIKSRCRADNETDRQANCGDPLYIMPAFVFVGGREVEATCQCSPRQRNQRRDARRPPRQICSATV